MAKEKTVAVEGRKWKGIRLRVEGLPPGLLQNKIRPDAIDALRRKALGLPASKEKPQYTALEIAEAGAHTLEEPANGCVYCIPAVAFHKAMVQAGRYAGEVMTKVTRGLSVEGVESNGIAVVPFETEGLEVREDVAINKKTTGGQSAVVVFRPWFRQWSAELCIEFDPKVFTADRVADLLNTAGTYIGIGPWRPETGGRFGKFQVVKS